MASQISQPKPWRPPPVVIVDSDSRNGGSRRGVKPTVDVPPHGGESSQPIIIETHPSSTTPGPQTIVIAPPPAAAQGPPRSPVYILPGSYEPSYEPRFYPTTPAYYPSEYTSVKPVAGSPSHYGRSTTPPPPGYDSWSFVDDRFSTRRRRPHRPTDQEVTFSEPHPQAEDEGPHRRRRSGEAGRRRRRAESSSGRITFPRYGPPTTVIETSAEGETMFDSAPPSSPPPIVVVGPQTPPGYDHHTNHSMLFSDIDDSIATVMLGFTTEGDEFMPRLGNGRIRRPASWRRDYWPRGRVLSYIPGLIRRGFSSSTLNDAPVMRPRKLAQCILYRPPSSDKESGLEYDLRFDHSRVTLPTPTRSTPSFVFDSAELATVPPAEWMRLYHPTLPWYIDVERDASSAIGITVLEVLKQMHQQLMIPVMESDAWNEDMTKKVRKCVAQGLRRRARKGPDGGLIFNSSGAVRLDFLGNEYIFEGLTKGKNGIWEIKTRDWRS